ncbi:MAG: purine-nucleoside phosphorylase [Coriobacteriia bacterium]
MTERMSDGGLGAAHIIAEALRERSGGVEPRALVILGSGLEGVVDGIDAVSIVPFSEVPGFPPPTVQGHAGRFVFGHAGAVPLLIMQGRVHYYEGHPISLLASYVRAARLLGAETLVVTNAAGGVAPALEPGSIVLLSDHINLMFTNPLIGPNADAIGPRFPVMADAYTPVLRALAHDVASELGVSLTEGVYAALTGPTFETAAEVRMLRTLGADVVGMSTVPEVIAAVHAGMQVLGFSLVTNVAAGSGHGHEEVLAVSASAAPRLATLVAGILARL